MTAQVVEALVHAAIKFAILVPGFVLALAALMSWIERRQSAMIQDRVGPNRASIGGVRAWGLFHIIADTLKFALKENIVPRGSNPLLFRLAPFMAMAPALIVFAVMPVGPTNRWVVSNLDVGILFIFAIGSLSVYGATIAGWSSNNNFSLLGALRVSAQMISYEVSLALNLVGVFMVFGSINLQTIIEGQGALLGGVLPKWGIVVQPVAFFLFLAASIAETKRTPFDAPEGEPELVSGYFTEYSGLALATFLAKTLAQAESRRYGYRFVFAPGTIGAITWLARNEAHLDRIKHGLVVACVGDAGHMHYKRSRRGDAEIDRAVTYVLAAKGEPFEVRDFSPYGYDERQYCSPGFNLPVGSLSRTPHGRFPEYHTSADNLDFVQPAALGDSLWTYLQVCRVLEQNRRYCNTNPKCEPQLGRRGLYSTFGGKKDAKASEMAMLWVLNYADGNHTLLDIAELSAIDFGVISDVADVLAAHDLLMPAAP